MSDLTAKNPQVSRTMQQLDAQTMNTQRASQPLGSDEVSEPEQGRIQLTVRSRLRVLRMAPPIDDGFRPFRVF